MSATPRIRAIAALSLLPVLLVGCITAGPGATASPTAIPTTAPTPSPAVSPSPVATASPSPSPAPTASPSPSPSAIATGTPSSPPTDAPSLPPSDAPSLAPTASPTATVVGPSVAPTASASGSLGPTPVVGDIWRASATNYRGRLGERFTYDCKAPGTADTVWGTDVYTDDSSVCTAAVHAGVITFELGGPVTIEMRPGEDEYAGSERNGVTTLPWGSWSSSFVIVTEE